MDSNPWLTGVEEGRSSTTPPKLFLKVLVIFYMLCCFDQHKSGMISAMIAWRKFLPVDYSDLVL